MNKEVRTVAGPEPRELPGQLSHVGTIMCSGRAGAPGHARAHYPQHSKNPWAGRSRGERRSALPRVRAGGPEPQGNAGANYPRRRSAVLSIVIDSATTRVLLGRPEPRETPERFTQSDVHNPWASRSRGACRSTLPRVTHTRATHATLGPAEAAGAAGAAYPESCTSEHARTYEDVHNPWAS